MSLLLVDVGVRVRTYGRRDYPLGSEVRVRITNIDPLSNTMFVDFVSSFA